MTENLPKKSPATAGLSNNVGANAGLPSSASTCAALALSLIVFLGCTPQDDSSSGSSSGSSNIIELSDLEGQLHKPLVAKSENITVLLFTRTDCPIANRYAPEFQNIVAKFAGKPISFWMIYADPDESVAMIQKHRSEFKLDIPTLRDPKHQLVKKMGATVTPEVAVLDRATEMVYLGRIDNRYVNFGSTRTTATKHELIDVLTLLLDGKPIPNARQPAIGCPIGPL